MSKVYRTIKNVAEKFNLEKEFKYANREAFAKLPHCWEMLEDTKAKKLKRYGEVAEGLEEVLDPQINAIIDLITDMENILKRP